MSSDISVGKIPDDNAGNTLDTAKNLGTLGTTPIVANVKVLEDSINSSFALTYTKLTQFAGLDNFWTLFDTTFGTAYLRSQLRMSMMHQR